jgi:hypothetical protein
MAIEEQDGIREQVVFALPRELTSPTRAGT